MRVNRKSIAESLHPDRDEQFHYIATRKHDFLDRGQPLISVDSKKRELVGVFHNPGRTWRREAAEVRTHDFLSYALGVALPYGIYEPVRNKGMMVVGTSHDTAAFAVDAIALWLGTSGRSAYPRMTELLILCDAGGSNGYRTRLWKQPYTIASSGSTTSPSPSVTIRRAHQSGTRLTTVCLASSALTGQAYRYVTTRLCSTASRPPRPLPDSS